MGKVDQRLKPLATIVRPTGGKTGGRFFLRPLGRSMVARGFIAPGRQGAPISFSFFFPPGGRA